MLKLNNNEGRTKPWLIVLLVIIFALIITMTTAQGQAFVNAKILGPMGKYIAKECGGEHESARLDCQCKGYKFDYTKDGETTEYCLGNCGECACYLKNPETQEETEVPCFDLRDFQN